MKKLKHNHTLTDFLKFGIFAILLLMPILIFVPNAFYYGFNEHAVAQEKTEQVPVYYQTNEVSQQSDFVENNIYTLNVDNNAIRFDSFSVGVYDFYLIDGDLTNLSSGVYYATPYFTRYDSSRSNLQIIISSTEKYYTSSTYVIDFIYRTNYSNIETLIPYIIPCPRQYVKEYQPLVTNMSITDSMSYAWDSVWQNDLFSWTSNNGIYTVINNMNTTLGIPSQARLADYLTYITLFTVIYVIIDIVIGTFTMLTHLFNKEPK